MEKMLDEQIRSQIREMFSALDRPVEIVFFGSEQEGCEYCEQTLSLVGEVVELSDKLSVSQYDLEKDTDLARSLHVDKAPTLVITAREDGKRIDYGIRYAGIPAGSEFSVLINDLLLVSKGDSGLSDKTRQYLKTLQKPVNLQVFVTPT